jgi:hypothetical protein
MLKFYDLIPEFLPTVTEGAAIRKLTLQEIRFKVIMLQEIEAALHC